MHTAFCLQENICGSVIYIYTGAGDGVWGSCNLPYLGGTIHGAGAKDLRNTGETLPM